MLRDFLYAGVTIVIMVAFIYFLLDAVFSSLVA